MIETLTFLLAMLGYIGLTMTAARVASGALPTAFWRATAAVIVLHVVLVWVVRYEWQFAEATRNGYAGFVAFHTALLAIIASLVVGERIARRLVLAAFVIVTMGAIGAVFRYEAVAMYRLPVLLFATLGTAALVRAYAARRRRAAPAQT